VSVDTPGIGLGVAVGVEIGVLVAVAVGDGSGVLVALGVTVVVAVGLRVAVGVGVSVATTATTPELLDSARGAANATAALLPGPARAGAASIVRPLLVAAADRPRATTLHVPTMCKPRLPPKSFTIRRYCR